jgi:hypothetical protein
MEPERGQAVDIRRQYWLAAVRFCTLNKRKRTAECSESEFMLDSIYRLVSRQW